MVNIITVRMLSTGEVWYYEIPSYDRPMTPEEVRQEMSTEPPHEVLAHTTLVRR